MSTDEYVPDDDQVRGRYCDGTYAQTGHTTEDDDFDAWLARVRRDAWQAGHTAGFEDALLACEIATGVKPGPPPGPTPNPHEETPWPATS